MSRSWASVLAKCARVYALLRALSVKLCVCVCVCVFPLGRASSKTTSDESEGAGRLGVREP